MINAITATTIRIPTHTPALKMPSTNSHELKLLIAMNRAAGINIFFIMAILSISK